MFEIAIRNNNRVEREMEDQVIGLNSQLKILDLYPNSYRQEKLKLLNKMIYCNTVVIRMCKETKILIQYWIEQNNKRIEEIIVEQQANKLSRELLNKLYNQITKDTFEENKGVDVK
jgi:hypothetical protein